MNEEFRPGLESQQSPAIPAEASGPPSRPEGFGLSLEQVTALLAEKHKTVVDKNDPILMVVTILNAWLSEVEKLQARHKDGLSRLLTDKTDSYVTGVKEATDSLSQSLSAASVEGIRKVFNEHAATLQTFRKNVTWTAAIVAVSALVNVAAFVLLAVQAR